MGGYAKYLTAMQEADFHTLHQERKASSENLLQQVFEAGLKAVGYKNDPATISPQGPYVHGAGGLLSNPGQMPAMLSTLIQPIPGMVTELPRVDTGVLFEAEYDGGQFGGYDVPFFSTITGQTSGALDDFTNQPDGLCDDPPIAGFLKRCTQTAQYGRFSGKLNQLDRTRMGRLNNVGETTNFRVLQNPTTENPLVPQEAQGSLGGDWVNSEYLVRIHEAGTAFLRMLAPLTYTGTPLNDKAGGGARQFLGFNNIYTTGKVDVFTQLACPAMDSIVINWGNYNITQTNLQGRYIYQILEETHYALQQLAMDTGLAPATWCISMDRDLFHELCQIIPVQQYIRTIATINQINGTSNGAHMNFAGEGADRLRQEMFMGQWLPMNGQRVRVVLESGGTIGRTYTAATNTFVSSIYFHPLTVLGNIPVTYWQFFNHDNAQGRYYDEFISRGFTRTTDGGKFLWASSFRNWCGDIKWLTEPRIICHAPQLGARIQNVAYSPTMVTRSPYPSDSSFFQNGGDTQGQVIYGSPSWSPSTSIALGVDW